MTGRKAAARGWAAIIIFLLGAMTLSAPVGAGTEHELEAAKARLVELDGQATAATAEYDQAQAELAETQQEIEETLAELEDARAKVDRLQAQLDERARAAYLMGGTGTLELLIDSDSMSEFSDRVVFLDQLAEQDADIVTKLDVLTQKLAWEEKRLDELEQQQAAATERQKLELERIYSALEEAQALRDRYAEQLAEEEAAAAAAARAAQAAEQAQQTPSGDGDPGGGDPGGGDPGGDPGSIPTVGGGALQACPAPGTSFTDTYGAPRSGGRTHAGVDMMGGYGWPIYAAQTGRVAFSSSSLGGNQAYVYAANGDYTFYAHMQSYANVSGTVQAGTQIGTIGDTGNATGSPHLHFEYHPGGGGPVNPTPYVSAVC